MATVTRKPSGSYEVQWYENKKRKSKTFQTRKEAKEFMLMLDANKAQRASTILFGTLLEKYRDTETPKKKGARSETLRINRLLQKPIARIALNKLTKHDFQDLIDERLTTPSPKGGYLSPATVIREFTTIYAAINYALERELLEKSPLDGIKLPKSPEHRERVASDEEIELLKAAAEWDGVSKPTTATQLVLVAFLLSCRAGMRSGEILAIEDSWIEGNIIHLPREATKTASKRDVALNDDAMRLLNLAISCRVGSSPRVFAFLNQTNRDALWRRLRDRAGLGEVRDSHGNLIKEGLNFHDGRATFATWAASPDPKTGQPRLDVLALARQTGHKDLQMLQRYYRASASEIAKRLS